jgi:hypothetical protein
VTEITVPIGAPDRGVLRTDSIGYMARVVGNYYGNNLYQFRIVARYDNTTAAPIYFGRCFQNSRSPIYSIVRTDGPLASSGYNPVWACTGVEDFLILAPGASRVDTILVNGPNMFDGITKEPYGVTSGRVALRYSALWDCQDPATCKTPDSLWISNEFTVRTER